MSERINRLDVVRDANRRLEAARSGAGGLEQVVRDLLARAFDARLAEALWWIEERRREAQAAQAWSSADGAPGCPPEPPKPSVVIDASIFTIGTRRLT